MKAEESFLHIFSVGLRPILEKLDLQNLQEIRLRTQQPLLVTQGGREYFVGENGKLTSSIQNVRRVTKQELQETLEYMASHSLYAFEDEIRQGFLTLPGGHRVGLAGKIVLEDGKVKHIKHISCLNVRMSHQVKGCADEALPYLMQENEPYHTLIISPPGCGKTTMLRDLIRQISDGTDYFHGCTVGVVDERSELGGSYFGCLQNDLGIRTDVLDCCPKAEGMMMLVRSMAPRVIAVDEIGDSRDIQAIETVIHCGCRLIATVHGSDMEDVKRKPLLQRLVQERVFQRYLLLYDGGHIGQISAIFDERGTDLYRKGGQPC